MMFKVVSKFSAMMVCVALSLWLSACSESFTDARDGQSYNVVQIGTQTWMAENLNFDMGGAEASYCPEGDARKCGEYGRLYTWAEAQGVCPEGWRLPTREDFETLVKVADGLKADGSLDQNAAGAVLKSTSGWFKKGNGSDALGFKALPAGYMAADSKFDGIGGYAYFWSSTTDDGEGSFAHYLFLDFSSAAAELKSFDKGSARSVRCVK